ncbi:MAG: DUF2232 domain-containing protein [Alphaproteobacteria bacterium]
MWKATLIAVGAGIVSSLIFVAPISGLTSGMILVSFTQLPLFIVGLSLGVASAVIAAGTATALVVGFVPLSGVVPFAVTMTVPAVVVVRQALLSRTAPDGSVEWYPPGQLMAILTVYGALTFVAVTLYLAGEPGGIDRVLQSTLSQGIAYYFPEMTEADRIAAASQASAVFPAMLFGSWLFTVLINGVLAQAILVRSGHNLRPSPAYVGIEVPRGLAVALALSAALWLVADGTPGYAGRILTLVFAAPYFFQGLGVVHRVARLWPGRLVALVLFYILLLILPGGAGIWLVAGVGLVEHWVGLRRRLAGALPIEEED